MVKGLDYFREYFKDFQDSYVLIGGVACHIALDDAGLDFRATKDLDIVLCAEALNSEFVATFWAFVKEGGYGHQGKGAGDKQFYRFNKPANAEFPYMLELFSRQPDAIELAENSHLTPIPVDEAASSLSAILLNDDYYACIKLGRVVIEDVAILGPEYILPFKAKAWLDLTARKANGESVDSKNIKKHRNDVFTMFTLLAPDQVVETADTIKADLWEFLAAVKKDTGLDLKHLGIREMPLDEVLTTMTAIYQLETLE